MRCYLCVIVGVEFGPVVVPLPLSERVENVTERDSEFYIRRNPGTRNEHTIGVSIERSLAQPDLSGSSLTSAIGLREYEFLLDGELETGLRGMDVMPDIIVTMDAQISSWEASANKKNQTWKTVSSVSNIRCVNTRRQQLGHNRNPPDGDRPRFACRKCTRESRLCVLYGTDGKAVVVPLRPEDRSEGATPLTGGYFVIENPSTPASITSVVSATLGWRETLVPVPRRRESLQATVEQSSYSQGPTTHTMGAPGLIPPRSMDLLRQSGSPPEPLHQRGRGASSTVEQSYRSTYQQNPSVPIPPGILLKRRREYRESPRHSQSDEAIRRSRSPSR